MYMYVETQRQKIETPIPGVHQVLPKVYPTVVMDTDYCYSRLIGHNHTWYPTLQNIHILVIDLCTNTCHLQGR